MPLFRKLLVFDFETDGKNPDLCNPVQVAAKAIDARKLTPIPGAEFCIDMRPLGIDDLDTYLKTVTGYKDDDTAEETIKWHAKHRKCTTEEIIDRWRKAPDQRFAWTQFVNFVMKYNWKKNAWFAPIPCGTNIVDFDIPIADKLNDKYRVKTLFWLRDKIDLLDLFFYWFENLEEAPKNYQMDTVREFFGLSDENAHDALQDVRDCGAIICKFMRLHRSIAKRVKFKEGFKCNA